MTKAKGRARAKARAQAKAATRKKKPAKGETAEAAPRAGRNGPQANTMKNTGGTNIRSAAAMHRGSARSR